MVKSENQLKPKEKAVLDYIRRATEERGYAPSVRDICRALQYKSTSTVQMYLDRLLSYGLLCRENGKSRSLRPATAAYDILQVQMVKVAKMTQNGCLTDACFERTIRLVYPISEGSGELFCICAGKNECGIQENSLCVVRRQDQIDFEGIAVLADQAGGFALVDAANHREATCLGRVIAVAEKFFRGDR